MYVSIQVISLIDNTPVHWQGKVRCEDSLQRQRRVLQIKYEGETFHNRALVATDTLSYFVQVECTYTVCESEYNSAPEFGRR